MTEDQREQAIDALMGAIGGARLNGQPLFDADVQRMQVGKFVDLVVTATQPPADPICLECNSKHPFQGTCIACQREHCTCCDDHDYPI